MKYYLRLLSLPLTLLVTFITLFALWKIFDLPSAEILVEKIGKFFDSYGLIVFYVSALIEGMLLFGGYFPGVFVIFVSVLSADSLGEAILRVSIGTLGLMTAHTVNYLLGKYGWYKLLVKFGLKSSIENAKNNISNKGIWAIFGSYWLPSIASLADTAAGILQMPFKKFILSSITASIIWNSIVGTIVYLTGVKILVIATSGGITELLIQLSIVVIWSAILLIADFYKKVNKI